jgi:cellulose synthase/poly-beta-1,6-N-acetylglucosamine synthase-like glycosyltransferase
VYSNIALDILFVGAVTLIWFMLFYQSLLFFLGHRYWRHTHRATPLAPVPDDQLPGISVLVPCHNEELVIANSLHGFLALQYPKDKIEFLMIDDGSTDRTADCIRQFTSDPRVRLIETPPETAASGKASALNYALGFTRFPFIAIYDADNKPEPSALRPLAEELIRDPKLGAAIGMYRAFNRHDALLTRFLNIEGIAFQWILQAGRWMLMRFSGLPGTNYIIRRSVLDTLNGWDVKALTEDAELTIRVYQAGYQVKFVPSSVTWEQEPETLKVWFRQRRRWVRGSNYLFRKYAGKLLQTRPKRIGIEMLYSLSLYYLFFLAIVVSDLLFVLSASGLIRIVVPGPYGVVWFFAYITFVFQLLIAVSSETDEDSGKNFLLTLVMYFTYCQLWIPVVAAAFYDDFIAHREIKWVKTTRYKVAP